MKAQQIPKGDIPRASDEAIENWLNTNDAPIADLPGREARIEWLMSNNAVQRVLEMTSDTPENSYQQQVA